MRLGPTESKIELGNNFIQRKFLLVSLRRKKLDNAKRFLDYRCSMYSVSRPVLEYLQFETLTGDFCAVHCTREQYEDVQSVKQVFDHVLFSIRNVEISISEKLGYLTLREDDDSGDYDIFQNRIVSTTPMGVQLESNSVLFSQYFERDPSDEEAGDYGVIALESVHNDELYPYRPKERIRRDTTVLILIRSFMRKITEPDGSEREQPAVVVTRWYMGKIHRPQLPVSAALWSDLKDCAEQWHKTVHLIERGGRPLL